MARQVETPQTVVPGGLVVSYANADATNKHEFANTGREFISGKNGGGGSINVTVETPGTVDGDLAIADRVVPVAAGVDALLGPWPTSVYNQTSSSDRGKVFFEVDADTSVTVAVLKV